MSDTPIPFAPETLETIQRAFRIAAERRHEEVGLEHLLLAITDEAQARRTLTACGADVERLRRELTDVLGRAFTPVPAAVPVEPRPTLGFDRVVQQAMMHAVASSARQVDSGSLLVFLLQEEDNHAAYVLQSQGIERLLLLRVISHGPKGDGQAVPAGGEQGGAPSSDPLRAYATVFSYL
jgi:ATP-dependent Clp protease ATP-binding subunit ClpA